MASPFDLKDLMPLFLPSLPLYLLWIVGMVLALLRWQRHPGVSTLTLIALGLFFLSSLVGTISIYWLSRMQAEHAWSVSQMGLYYSALAVARTLLSCVGWVLLLIALFRWRSQPYEQESDIHLS